MSEQSNRDRLFAAAHALKKVRLQKLFPDISQAEFFALDHVEKAMETSMEGILVSELAKQLSISPPTVSRCLGKLEKKEYIIREGSPQDRRAVYVRLTKKGQDAKDRMSVVIEDFMDTVVKRLGDEKAILLTDLIREITEITKDELSKRERGLT